MNIPANIKSDAWLEGEYRYSLTRRWAEGPTLVSIMINPSVADGKKDDPTLLRNIHFANAWHFGGLEIVNPFARISSKQNAIFNGSLSLSELIGPKNDLAIEAALARGSMFLCAWGNPPSKCPAILDRIRSVESRIMWAARARPVPSVCLGRTMHGYPKHPLARGVHRVPDNQRPIEYLT